MLNKKGFFGKALSLSCSVVIIGNTFSVASADLGFVSKKDVNKSMENSVFYNFLCTFNFFGVFSERLKQMRLNEELRLECEAFYDFLEKNKNSNHIRPVLFLQNPYDNEMVVEYDVDCPGRKPCNIRFYFEYNGPMLKVSLLEEGKYSKTFEIGKNISFSRLGAIKQIFEDIVDMVEEESTQPQELVNVSDRESGCDTLRTFCILR